MEDFLDKLLQRIRNEDDEYDGPAEVLLKCAKALVEDSGFQPACGSSVVSAGDGLLQGSTDDSPDISEVAAIGVMVCQDWPHTFAQIMVSGTFFGHDGTFVGCAFSTADDDDGNMPGQVLKALRGAADAIVADLEKED